MCGFLLEYHDGIESNMKIELNVPSNLSNRGPDASVQFAESNFSSYFCRLIIRGGSDAMQPIRTSNGMVGFGNGQIFNYNEISKKIENQLFVEQNEAADIHLAVEYLSQNPESNWHELDGMFAIVLIDQVSKTIYMGRDRTGEKPIFYHQTEIGISISSLVEPILVNSEQAITVDQISVCSWLEFGLLEPGRTFFNEIHEVEPGSVIVYQDKSLTKKIYWTWPKRGNSKSKRNEIQEILNETLSLRVEKNSEICLSLSAGVDSGAIISSAHYRKEISNAILLSFENKGFDEVDSINLDYLATKIEYEIISFEKSLNRDILTRVIELMDQPIADLACIPFFMICEKAVTRNKVLMTGDGGDEIFLGYRAFKYEKIALIFWFACKIIPRHLRTKILIMLLSKRENQYLSGYNMWSRLLAGSLSKKGNQWAVAISPNFAYKMFKKDKVGNESKFVPKSLEKYFQNCVLPQIYLQKADRMSMGQGLEARTPYLANSILNFGTNLSRRQLRIEGKPHETLLDGNVYRGKRIRKKGLGVPTSTVLSILERPKWDGLSKYVDDSTIETVWERRSQNGALGHLAWSFYVLNYYLNKWESLGVIITDNKKVKK